MMLIKIIILQVFWYLTVSCLDFSMAILLWPLSFVAILLNLKFFSPSVDKTKYLFLLVLFSLWGGFQDISLWYIGIIKSLSHVFILNSLWIIFLAYYGDIFNKFYDVSKLLTSLLGAIGGCASYYFGLNLAGYPISAHQLPLFFIIVGLSWSLFFPLSLYIFYQPNLWGKLLDLSIVFSFDSSGFKRHKKEYFLDEKFSSLKNKKILVTGGTSGIGLSLCDDLCSYGAEVLFTGRNTKVGQKLNTNCKKFYQLDMNDWDSFENFSHQTGALDGIVFNAGGMPIDFSQNQYDVETQAASQLFGHYYLLNLLKKNGKLKKDCKIIWVSSGGMYLKKLDLENLKIPKSYDRVAVYANVKRAQITLVEELSKDTQWKDFKIMAMHPGWVKTEAIKLGLPRFYSFTNKRLRTPSEGADTILWLLGTKNDVQSGKFYFDRHIVSAYINEKYKPSKQEREMLMKLVETTFSA